MMTFMAPFCLPVSRSWTANPCSVGVCYFCGLRRMCSGWRNMIWPTDGSVHFLSDGVGRITWHTILGVNNGVTGFDVDDITAKRIVTKLKLGNCLRLALFVLLTFFPLPWVWLHPTSATTTSSVVENRKQAPMQQLSQMTRTLNESSRLQDLN